MRLHSLTRLLFVGFLFILFYSSHTFSSSGRNNNSACSNCHTGTNPGTISLTGIPSMVDVNTTHSAQVCISDPVNANAPAVGGFRFFSNLGSYSNLGSGVRTGGSGSNLGLTHSSPKSINSGQVCWTFDWTAPASAGSANIQLYGNAANGNGANGNGDHGGYQMFPTIDIVNSCASDLVIIDDPIPSGTYQSSNTITAMTTVEGGAMILFDAPEEVNLLEGFEVPMGAEFETIVGLGQGCFTDNTNESSAQGEGTTDEQ